MRKLTREEARLRRYEYSVTIASLCLTALFVVCCASATAEEKVPTEKENAPEPQEMAVEEIMLTGDIFKEAVPMEYDPVREDIPLDADTQRLLYKACDETGIRYELALAVIEQETNFRNIAGDGGESQGYMQIQEKWHWDRMERLGVDDLTDPYSNFLVGCDFLAELCGKYEIEEALTAYNRGTPGQSAYANAVIENMKILEELNNAE